MLIKRIFKMGLNDSGMSRFGLILLEVVVLTTIVSCARKEQDVPRLVGPIEIDSSGNLLLCTVKSGEVHNYYVVSLDAQRRPIELQFPSSDYWFGTWRPGTTRDELLLVSLSGSTRQTIVRLQVSDTSASVLSSTPVDANLFVTVRPSWLLNREVLALQITRHVKGVFSGSYMGFSKDNGQTISISDVNSPTDLLWVDSHSFYMVYSTEDNKMVMSYAQLDVNDLTLQTRELFQKDDINLATKSLNGSLIYVTRRELFVDNGRLASLPEDVGRPFVDGRWMVCVARNGKRLYVLDDKGQIVDTKLKSRETKLIGLSAVHRSVYLLSEDDEKILAYSFADKSEQVIFDLAKRQ
jgi:hypothetical protein